VEIPDCGRAHGKILPCTRRCTKRRCGAGCSVFSAVSVSLTVAASLAAVLRALVLAGALVSAVAALAVAAIQPVSAPDDATCDLVLQCPRVDSMGRWLAGLAPIGYTGFVVIVQTRYDAAVGPNARLSRRLAQRTGAVLLAWVIVFGTGLWLFRRDLPSAR
jgi:hypothetical protein